VLAARHLAAAASVGVGDWEWDTELYLASHALPERACQGSYLSDEHLHVRRARTCQKSSYLSEEHLLVRRDRPELLLVKKDLNRALIVS
jgi:hypothetical protein